MSNPALVKKTLVDKNGVTTTRLINPNKGIPAPSRGGNVSSINSASGTGLYEPKVAVPEPSKKARIGEGEQRLQHTTFEFEDFEWSLAPEGYSGAHCGKCKSFFTDEQVDAASASGKLTCEACGRESDDGVLQSGVRYGDRKYFSKGAVREETWYHITVRNHWGEDITESDDVNDQPFVHLGSKEAALVRMKALVEDEARDPGYKGSHTQYYCYEVKVKPAAPIADAVLPDDNEIAPKKPSDFGINYISSEGYEEYGVNRYVNEFESHGSISLLAHPSSFEIMDSYPVDTNYNDKFTAGAAA